MKREKITEGLTHWQIDGQSESPTLFYIFLIEQLTNWLNKQQSNSSTEQMILQKPDRQTLSDKLSNWISECWI